MKTTLMADGPGVKIWLKPENDLERALLKIFNEQALFPGNRVSGGELSFNDGGGFAGLELTVVRAETQCQSEATAVTAPASATKHHKVGYGKEIDGVMVTLNVDARGASYSDAQRIGEVVAEGVKTALSGIAVTHGAAA